MKIKDDYVIIVDLVCVLYPTFASLLVAGFCIRLRDSAGFEAKKELKSK